MGGRCVHFLHNAVHFRYPAENACRCILTCRRHLSRTVPRCGLVDPTTPLAEHAENHSTGSHAMPFVRHNPYHRANMWPGQQRNLARSSRPSRILYRGRADAPVGSGVLFCATNSRRKRKPDVNTCAKYSLRKRCARAMYNSTSICVGFTEGICEFIVVSFICYGTGAASPTCGGNAQTTNHNGHVTYF